MPLTERTERALEACYDAILAPTQWSSALQLLGESFGAASCTLYEHDRENSPAPVPMSVEHEAYSVRWERNQAHAPDPHVGPYLQKATSFIRAGWPSAIEHQLSTEEERRTLPFSRRRRGRRTANGLRRRISRSTAATGAFRSTAETTRLRPRTRYGSAGSDRTSPKSSAWPESSRRSTSRRNSRRSSE